MAMNRRDFLAGVAGASLAQSGLAATPDAVAAPLPAVDQLWIDAARGREVPVRLHLPARSAAAPVILFSHGLGGSCAGGERWGQVWAAKGFLSIHLQHHGSDEALWKDRNPLAAFASLKRAMNAENALLRVQDIVFVLDELARRRRAGDPLLAAADLDRIGLSGHSFGARTTIAVVSQMTDPRIRAAIAFSPVGEGSDLANRERSGRIRIPFLSLTGSEDRVPILNDTTPQERRIPYQTMPGPDKYLLVLAGADHMLFNGDPQGRRWSDANREIHAPLVERVSVAFWQAYLREDPLARAELGAAAMQAVVGANGEWFAK